MIRESVLIQNGPFKGRSVVIDGALTIGRSPENGLQLDDIQISRKHAVIEQTPAGTVVRDLGSGNGTYVGTKRISEYRLSPGDIVNIGPMALVFQGPEEAPPTGRSIAEPLELPGSGVRFADGAAAPVAGESPDAVYQTLFRVPGKNETASQVEALQERLKAIYEANQIIASENDLEKLFERVIDQVFRLVPAHNGVILLVESRGGRLEPAFVKTGDGAGEIAVSTTIVNRAIEKNEAILTFNAAGDDRFAGGAGASIIAQNIASAMCVPLNHRGENLGVIYVDTHGTRNAFAHGDLELLVALSGPAAIAIKNAQYLKQIERAYHDTLIALANAIELRDHYTVGHTWRVTNFALETAKSLGWDEKKLKECEMGGVLHDIGKISIDDAILRKPDRLTEDEYAKMKVHPERGARMMQDIDFLLPLVPYALYHHERFDGKGYPYGLEGPNIPLEGRLLAVADTFDAMTSNRPYRKGLDPTIAIAELEKGKGTQFDPVMVDAFIKAYNEGRIERILQDYFKDERSVACPFCSTYLRIEEGQEENAEFSCNVCHRRLKLRFQNGAYFAEQLSGSSIHVPPHLRDEG